MDLLRCMGLFVILILSAVTPTMSDELFALTPPFTQRGDTLALSSNEHYDRLKEKLDHYQALAETGGWPTIKTTQVLAPGSRHPQIIKLRLRLALTNDYTGHLVISDFFDHELEQGVRRFQRRHGLKGDGKVGPKTLAALNVSAKTRVSQIIINLERLRQDQNAYT
ncbi:MAG: hypothetical protein C0614_06425, partial [Desulfuromonas sp.]